MKEDTGALALRLTPGQRSTILGLGERPSILGCSEQTAKRMCISRINRPALVTEWPPEPGETPNRYSLNECGQAVRAILAEGTPA